MTCEVLICQKTDRSQKCIGCIIPDRRRRRNVDGEEKDSALTIDETARKATVTSGLIIIVEGSFNIFMLKINW